MDAPGRQKLRPDVDMVLGDDMTRRRPEGTGIGGVRRQIGRSCIRCEQNVAGAKDGGRTGERMTDAGNEYNNQPHQTSDERQRDIPRMRASSWKAGQDEVSPICW